MTNTQTTQSENYCSHGTHVRAFHCVGCAQEHEAAKTRTVSLHELALAACKIPGEADHEAAIADLVGRPAVYVTYEGARMEGVLEAPITGAGGSGGYPVVRFSDGRWGRCDDEIHLLPLPSLVEVLADHVAKVVAARVAS